MHLHNFLIDYRDAHDVDYNFEASVSQNDCNDNGLTAEVLGNNNRRPNMGRQSTADETFLQQGLRIRDGLRQAIYDHDMVRPHNYISIVIVW